MISQVFTRLSRFIIGIAIGISGYFAILVAMGPDNDGLFSEFDYIPIIATIILTYLSFNSNWFYYKKKKELFNS